MEEIRGITREEIANYRENVRRIEELSGYPIPRGLLSIKDLGRPMTPKEISIYRENIRRLEESRGNLKRKGMYEGSGDNEVPASIGYPIIVFSIFMGMIVSKDFSLLLPVSIVVSIPILLKMLAKFLDKH